MLQRKEHSQCGLSSLSFFLGLFIVLVYVVVFVDLRAMLAHLERRLSGIPWAGRQAGRQPAGKLCLSSPLSVSPLARLPLQLLQGNISPATTTTSATARARATVPTTTRAPFYVAALMALYYWQSSSTRYARKRWRCSTTANLYGNRCARHIFNADFSILSSNPLSRRKSM